MIYKHPQLDKLLGLCQRARDEDDERRPPREGAKSSSRNEHSTTTNTIDTTVPLDSDVSKSSNERSLLKGKRRLRTQEGRMQLRPVQDRKYEAKSD